MSANDSPGREVAHRVFATEFDDATFQYSEGDEERAPNYVVTPTGTRVNRLFFVGVLTETERVNEDVLRARVVDPTGAFVIYAGQYQPDELAALERTEAPAFVAVTGKARTFEPDDGDRIYTSVRPESINEVDGDTRDRWVVQAAEHTLDRIATMATAATLEHAGEDLADALRERGVGESLAAGVPIALDQYGTGPAYLDALRTAALDAARVVAGDRDEVRTPDLAPDGTRADATAMAMLAESGPGTFVRIGDAGEDGAVRAGTEREAEVEPEFDRTTGAGAESDTEPEMETETESEPGTEPEPEIEPEPEPEKETEPERTAEAAPGTDPETDRGRDTGEVEESATVERKTVDDEETETMADEETETTADDETETTADQESETTADDDDLGDFEGGSLSADETTDEGAPATEEMYEFDEEERQQIEEEYGTEFETGTEVAEPGEADIDAPTSESTAEPDALEPEPTESTGDEGEEAEEPETTEPAEASDGMAEPEPADSSAGTEASEPTDDDVAAPGAAVVAADADVDGAVMDAMRDLDDGDGAEREAVIEAVTDATGADPEAVEDAIQDALMGGQCYEPGEDRLKPI